MMKLKTTQSLSLALIFILMCILKLWTSIFIVFTFGFLMTLLTSKKTFCAGFCPMGALQDFTSTREIRPFLKLSKTLKLMIFFAFWGVIAASVILNPGNPYMIWWSLFKFAVLIAALSLLLQMVFANRTWCTAFCPLGSSYSKLIRLRRG